MQITTKESHLAWWRGDFAWWRGDFAWWRGDFAWWRGGFSVASWLVAKLPGGAMTGPPRHSENASNVFSPHT